jgi:hypothetical protein
MYPYPGGYSYDWRNSSVAAGDALRSPGHATRSSRRRRVPPSVDDVLLVVVMAQLAAVEEHGRVSAAIGVPDDHDLDAPPLLHWCPVIVDPPEATVEFGQPHDEAATHV